MDMEFEPNATTLPADADPVVVRAAMTSALEEIDLALAELGEANVTSESTVRAASIQDAVLKAMQLVDSAEAETNDEAPSAAYIAYCLRTMRSVLEHASHDIH
ncbi:MAG: hypothetical protein AAF432_12120 [Planctomycetota bacterium]